MRSLKSLALLPVVLALVACAAPGASPGTTSPASVAPATASAAVVTEAPTMEPTQPATEQPTEDPSEEPTDEPTATATEPAASPTPGAEACVTDDMLKNPGRLTLSTDIPAFPPWWGGDAAEEFENEPEGGSEWSSADFSAEPYSMEGLEGATAYAIAEALGFSADEVDWIANPVFEQAFAPGPKPFDFHMAQVSIREDRAQAVDFSEPYFDANQSVLALSGNDIVNAASIEDLRAFRLGAAGNTTSFELIDTVIQPTQEASVYPDNSAALTALQNGQIDGLIVDLGSAFYMRDAQLENFDTPDPEGRIVGQFGEGVQVDQVGAVLEKDSPFTACVNQALVQLRADGTLDQILDEWIVSGQEIPFLE